MAESGTDILMMMTKGSALATDLDVAIDSADAGQDGLLKGFRSGNCCLLSSFSLSAGGAGRVAESHDKPGATHDKPDAPAGGTSGTGKNAGAAADKKHIPPGAPQPVTFKRRVDAFSPRLLSALVAGKDFDSVSVVKRRAGGSSTSGLGYLRLDFTGVLLVSLDWSDDDEGMEEEGRFVYRGLTVRYRPQLPSGRLGVAVGKSWPGGTS